MIYDCKTCKTQINIEPDSKQFCTTCRLWYTGVHKSEKNETVAGTAGLVVAVETPERKVRDMR